MSTIVRGKIFYFKDEIAEAKMMLKHLKAAEKQLESMGITSPDIMPALEHIRKEIELQEEVHN